MKSDRECHRNCQNDYLIYVLTQFHKPQPSENSAHKTAFAGSLELLRAVSGKRVPRRTASRTRKVRVRTN